MDSPTKAFAVGVSVHLYKYDAEHAKKDYLACYSTDIKKNDLYFMGQSQEFIGHVDHLKGRPGQCDVILLDL